MSWRTRSSGDENDEDDDDDDYDDDDDDDDESMGWPYDSSDCLLYYTHDGLN